MLAIVKWLGFTLIAVALSVLPFAVWVSARWGIVSATAGLIGVVLLVIGLAGRRAALGAGDPNSDVPPGPGGRELRGFPGADALDHHDGDGH